MYIHHYDIHDNHGQKKQQKQSNNDKTNKDILKALRVLTYDETNINMPIVVHQ